MELLEKNWNKIRIKVVLPLWNGRYKSMFESVKLDYDDFESLAGIELTKAIKTFDPEKSNIYTYATRVITQKAKTELRDCTQRDRRKSLYVSESIEALDEETNEPIVAVEPPSDALSDKMVTYLSRLSRLQKQILFAVSEGYSNDEIKKAFGLSSKELADAYASIKSYRNISILF